MEALGANLPTVTDEGSLIGSALVRLCGAAQPLSAEYAMTVTDLNGLASLFDAIADIPARQAKLEQQADRILGEIASIERRLPPALVGVAEAARLCGVSVPTMRRWIKTGEVASIKIGGTLRVDVSRLRGSDTAQVMRLASDARRPPVAAHAPTTAARHRKAG